MDRLVSISKALLYYLRHGAVKEKLQIDSRGYVKVSELLETKRLKSLKTTQEDILQVVAENNKQRFSLESRDELYICANQGHTLREVNNDALELLTPETMPNAVYHGTYSEKLAQIEKVGLSRMRRNHIHFTLDSAWSVSGIRNNCNVLIYIDTASAMADGYEFFRSRNGVILCAGNERGLLPPKYFLYFTHKSANSGELSPGLLHTRQSRPG